MRPGFRFPPIGWTAAIAMMAALGAALVVAAPGGAAGPLKVNSVTFESECVLAPGVLNEKGTVKIHQVGEAPETVLEGESFSVVNDTITIVAPKNWGETLFNAGSRTARGFVTNTVVEVINAIPTSKNIAKPPEFINGLPIQTKVEPAPVEFTVPSENRKFNSGPYTANFTAAGLTARGELNTAAAFKEVSAGHWEGTGEGIISEVSGLTETGETAIGPLTVACTAPAHEIVSESLITAPESTEKPKVSGLEPNEIGSNGGQKVIIHGERFIPTSVVHYGEAALKVKATGTAAKGESVEKSATEIEMNPPFREHGKRLVEVCNPEPTEMCSSKTLEPAHNQMTVWPELYRNEAAVGTGHISNLGYGEVLLNSPQITTQIECVNVGFGTGWNEAPSGHTGPISGHGEILVYWASGHTPKTGHTELSNRCRFVFHGTEEVPPTGPTAWASAEPPLHNVIQEGIVCTEKTERELAQCPNEVERSHINITREATRESLSLPWNIQFTEKSEKPHVRIGLPDECKGKAGTERTELSKCPELSEREPSKSPEGCNVPPTPDPPGCLKVEILSSPPLNIHMEYEGYVEPHGVNSGPSGLSPSSWEFEGAALGEPALHLAETTTTEGSTTGALKVLGFSAQELMTVK